MKLTQNHYTFVFGLLLALAFYLRLDALAEQQRVSPNGNDGSLEFQKYAEHLLDYTLKGERFPPGTVMHMPVFSALLAGVFSLFDRSAYVQYATTLVVSMGQLVVLFWLVRQLYGVGWGVIAVFLLAINAEVINDAVEGGSVPLLILVLLGLLVMLVRQREEAGTGATWSIGLLAAMATLTREEGWFLVLALVGVLGWLERRQLKVWCLKFYPLMGLPVLAGVLHALFRQANRLPELSSRYGTYFFKSDFINDQMPEWYHRVFIHSVFFSMSYREWLFDFHAPSQFPLMLLEGLDVLLSGVVQVLSVPVAILAIAGVLLAFRAGWRQEGMEVQWVGLSWIAVSLLILSPVAVHIGDDQLGGRNHYLLLICALVPLVAIRGGHCAQQWRVWDGRLIGVLAIGLLLAGYYSYYQSYVYGRYTSVPSKRAEENSVAAFTALRQGEFARAHDIFNEVLADNPRYAPAHFGQGLAGFNMAQFEKGDAAFRKAIDIFPWYAEAYVALATMYGYAGDEEKGAALLRQCLEARPDFVPAHLLLAQFNLQLQRHGAALAHYEAYIDGVLDLRKRIIRNLDEFIERSQANTNLTSALLAERAWFATLSSVPMISLRLHERLYLHLDSQGRYVVGGQGVEMIRLMDTYIHYNLGNLLFDAQKASEAIGHYETFLGLYPNHPGATNNLGIARANAGDLEGARTLLHQAHQQEPKNFRIQNNLGCVYGLMADYATGQRYLEQAIGSQRPAPAANLALLATSKSGLSPPASSYRFMFVPSVYDLPNIVGEKAGAELIRKGVNWSF
jgi:Flp pilus assembly protein TadD